MKNTLIFIIAFWISFINIKAQELIWEQTYDLAWSCGFSYAIYSSDSNIVIASSKMDSSGPFDPFEYVQTSLTKLEKNGKLIWDVVNNKFSSNNILFENKNSEYVTGINYFKGHSGDVIGDFYLWVSKFNSQGKLLFENIDTISKQSVRLWHPGVDYHLFEGGYLSAIDGFDGEDSTFLVILKRYDEDGRFLKEDTLPYLKRGSYYLRMDGFDHILRKKDGGLLISGKLYGTKSFYPEIALILRFDKSFKLRGYSQYYSSTNFYIFSLLELKNDNFIMLGGATDSSSLKYNNIILIYDKNGFIKDTVEFKAFHNVTLNNINLHYSQTGRTEAKLDKHPRISIHL